MLLIHGLECEKCGKMFRVEDMLQKHKEIVHKVQVVNIERPGQVIVSRKIGEHATHTRNATEDSN